MILLSDVIHDNLSKLLKIKKVNVISIWDTNPILEAEVESLKQFSMQCNVQLTWLINRIFYSN